MSSYHSGLCSAAFYINLNSLLAMCLSVITFPFCIHSHGGLLSICLKIYSPTHPHKRSLVDQFALPGIPFLTFHVCYLHLSGLKFSVSISKKPLKTSPVQIMFSRLLF